MAHKQHVLVVDDELSMRELLEIVLDNAGYAVTAAPDVTLAIELLEKNTYDVVITDLYMGNDREAGMRLLTWLGEHNPELPTIMMTAHGSVERAVEAMRLGAFDYIQKPFKNDEIKLRVGRAIQQRNLQRENTALRKDQANRASIDGMIGNSPAFQEVLEMVRRVAALPSTIAIHGESGAGKELVARALHNLSHRANKPFVAINCGGIPENLLESELFGYKKGAFTGATEDKEGLFVVANGGTIFLDEIGEMPQMLQVKLLRVLDNNTVTPVGGTQAIKVDVRIISATNRDLKKMSDKGEFRSDLYYRLNVIPIHMPPLRERLEDIPLLAKHFVAARGASMGRPGLDIAADAAAALLHYPWPGNVRELGNVIERAVALCRSMHIDASDLPDYIQHHRPEMPNAAGDLPEGVVDIRLLVAKVETGDALLPTGGLDLEDMIAKIEIALIKQALQKGRYSQKRAAELLTLTARSLRYRLQKYGLEEEE